MAIGEIAFGGTLVARRIQAQQAPLRWKLRNLRNVWPGVWRHAVARTLKMNHMLATLRAVKYSADGTVTDYGIVSTQMITDAFCTFLAAQLITDSTEIGDFKYHETGTGVGAEAAGNTSLTFSTEMVGDIRGVGTQVQGGTALKYKSIATITYDGTGGAITEHGLFSNTRASGGTLMDRSVFSAINVVATDSIAFTYELSLTSGG